MTLEEAVRTLVVMEGHLPPVSVQLRTQQRIVAELALKEVLQRSGGASGGLKGRVRQLSGPRSS